MPKSDSPKPVISEIEQLFLDIIPLIPAVVRQACQSLNHHPNQMEFDSFVSRIRFFGNRCPRPPNMVVVFKSQVEGILSC